MSLERDEFAERICVTLPTYVRKYEGSSFLRVGFFGLAILLRDLDLDRHAEMETVFLRNHSRCRILVY